MPKKPAKVPPAIVAGVEVKQQLDFTGMTLDQIRGQLGLPADATLKEIRREAEIAAGIRKPRIGKTQKEKLGEKEREELKKKKKEKGKKKRSEKKKWHESIGIPSPERPKLSEEERKERRSQRGKRRRDDIREMKEWSKSQRKELEKLGLDVPDWMKKLK